MVRNPRGKVQNGPWLQDERRALWGEILQDRNVQPFLKRIRYERAIARVRTEAPRLAAACLEQEDVVLERMDVSVMPEDNQRNARAWSECGPTLPCSGA